MDWPDSNNWKNRDFIILSEQIFNETRVKIHISTLKRIWGKIKYNSLPNLSTLNVLAQFAGYENYTDFLNQRLSETDENTVNSPANIKTNKKKLGIGGLFGLVGGLLIVVGLGYTLWFNPPKLEKEQPFTQQQLDGVYFAPQQDTGYAPRTLTLRYDVSSLNIPPEDTIMLQVERFEKPFVNQTKGMVRTAYHYIGPIRCSLYYKNQEIATCLAYNLTRKWAAMVKHKFERDTNKDETIMQKDYYYLERSLNSNGAMYLSDSICQLYWNRPIKSIGDYIDYCWAENLHITGDSVDVKFRVRPIVQKPYNTHSRKLYSVGFLGSKNGFIEVPLAEKGHSVSSNLYLGLNNVFLGSKHDLSKFETNLNEWHTVTIKTRNPNISIWLDGKEILNDQYTDPIGDIWLFKIRHASGTGMLDYITITTPQGDTLYKEDFN